MRELDTLMKTKQGKLSTKKDLEAQAQSEELEALGDGY